MLSFFLIQQPQQFFSWAIDFICFQLASLARVRSNKFNLQIDMGTLLFSNGILLCSLLLTTLSDNSLATTQVGTMIIFMWIAMFYTMIGRFGIDPFHTSQYIGFWTFFTIFAVTLFLNILAIAYKSGQLERLFRRGRRAQELLRLTSAENNFLEYPEDEERLLSSSELKDSESGLLFKKSDVSLKEDLTKSLLSNQRRKRIVQVRNLTKIIGESRVVDNFSLDIYGGEILSLLGNNGSGKTTLINLLTGLMEPEIENGGDAWLCTSPEDKISMRDQPHKFRSLVRLC